MRVDPLLEDYPIRIREVTIAVILGISLIFYCFPKFLGEAEKIEQNIIEEIETFDIPQTEQIKIPEPPARPSVPVASEDEFFDEDITIEDTDFDEFEDWDSAPPIAGGPKVTFIAFDKPPKAKISSLIDLLFASFFNALIKKLPCKSPDTSPVLINNLILAFMCCKRHGPSPI